MEMRTGLKALIIEDDTEMASLLKRIISKKFSIDVDVAYDCATARRKLETDYFDLITLDYRLPDGAGLDLLDEITGGGRVHPPVIMVTGHGDEETAARSFRSRASGYVVKDAKLPELLIDAVEKALAEISLKRVEKELLEEKVFIEDALNGLPDLFAVVDMDGVFFRWNHKVTELTGYTNAEISKMRIVDLFREEDHQKLQDGMMRLRNEGFAVDEVMLETKAGEHRYYELSGRLLRNFDGIPIGFSGIGRDITERVLASHELSRYRDELEELVSERTTELQQANAHLELEIVERVRAEEHFRSIIENSTDVIAILAADTTILEISPSIEPMLGYTTDFMNGKSVLEFVHPDDVGKVVETHKSVADGEKASNASDCRFKHADGTWHTLSVVGRVFQDTAGDMRIIVNARDVTRTQEAQRALEESEERYRSIFELSPDLIFLIEKGGRLIEANEAALESVGLTMDVYQTMNYMDFFTGADPSDIHAAIEELLEGRTVRGLEVSARTASGENHQLEINAIPFRENGETTRVLGLARDITERKVGEDELRRLNRELEGYAQTVSHDLRSPLTAIKLAADNLARVWEKRSEIDDLDAEVLRIAEVVRASAGQAEDLIADLLALAQAGQQPEEVSEVDVSSTVRRIIEEHSMLIDEVGATVIVANELGTLRANPTHVYQVFSNLIDNGIKHNTSDSPLVEVKYLGNTPAGHTYTVKDNGPGIPPEDAENIFLPFYRGRDGSTGIGLAIVEKLVKLYGGDIRVYANNGACFEFTIKDL